MKISKIPFKLWLEFEETDCWNDLKNDFANVIVDMLDGRIYDINVWTYNFLEAVIKQNKENGNNLNGLYEVPPDLFVQELNEKIITDLLNKGDLEKILNNTIFDLKFMEPYWGVNEMKEQNVLNVMNELHIELSENHLLQNEKYELIARKTNNDDIVLDVHLTWKSKQETGKYPITRIYKDKIDFWKKEMKHDIFLFE